MSRKRAGKKERDAIGKPAGDAPAKNNAVWWALGVSILSLALSVNGQYATRRLERINARPILRYIYYYGEDGAGWKFENGGPGIARLRGFRMFVDRRPVTDYDTLVNSLDLPDGEVRIKFTNPLVGDRYPAGMTNTLLWIPQSPAAVVLRRQWQRVDFQACYCSVYDECWIFSTDGSTDTPDGEHGRDDDCSIFSGEQQSRWWRG